MHLSPIFAPFLSYTHALFFFNDTATTEIYTLSLHDALPISYAARSQPGAPALQQRVGQQVDHDRSEEHTSELQSRQYLVCRLLLEKKKQQPTSPPRKQTLYSIYAGTAHSKRLTDPGRRAVRL